MDDIRKRLMARAEKIHFSQFVRTIPIEVPGLPCCRVSADSSVFEVQVSKRGKETFLALRPYCGQIKVGDQIYLHAELLGIAFFSVYEGYTAKWEKRPGGFRDIRTVRVFNHIDGQKVPAELNELGFLVMQAYEKKLKTHYAMDLERERQRLKKIEEAQERARERERQRTLDEERLAHLRQTTLVGVYGYGTLDRDLRKARRLQYAGSRKEARDLAIEEAAGRALTKVGLWATNDEIDRVARGYRVICRDYPELMTCFHEGQFLERIAARGRNLAVQEMFAEMTDRKRRALLEDKYKSVRRPCGDVFEPPLSLGCFTPAAPTSDEAFQSELGDDREVAPKRRLWHPDPDVVAALEELREVIRAKIRRRRAHRPLEAA